MLILFFLLEIQGSGVQVNIDHLQSLQADSMSHASSKNYKNHFKLKPIRVRKREF